jgi:hypothetical protein
VLFELEFQLGTHSVSFLHFCILAQPQCLPSLAIHFSKFSVLYIRAGKESLPSFDPFHPLCPLQLDADADWNADTGATSHMTVRNGPNRKDGQTGV